MISTAQSEKVAIVTTNEAITYSQLFNKIEGISQLIHCKPNNRIAIFAENRAEWIYALYAGWLKNCTIVPIDYLSTPSDVSYILNDCLPDLIFTSDQKIADLKIACDKAGYHPTILNFDTLEIPETSKEIIDLKPNNKENTAVIIYTSGTTGSPKGVMLTYTNILANLHEVCHEVNIFRPERQVLLLLPLHHIFPLIGTLVAPLFVGSTVAMSPSIKSSDVLATLKNNDVAILIGVPRFFDVIYKGLKEKIEASKTGRIFFNLLSKYPNQKLAIRIFKKVHDGFGGKLRIMVSGGAALSPETGNFFKTLGFTILEGFGMTETSPMITFNRPSNFRIGSPGQPLKSVEVKIADGEIIARGPNVMKGYYNRPEETAAVIKDGWLHTGDLGYLDKDNFLYITGRRKEIIVLPSGKNINPAEIEQKLEEFSSYVLETAIMLKDDKLFSIIVPNTAELEKAGVTNFESFFKKDVIASFNSQLSSYKRIMHFVLFHGELPRTRLEKIQRFKLDSLIEPAFIKKEKNKTATEPSTETYKMVRIFIEDQMNTKISPEDNLEMDIAIDSLGKLSLIDFIERSFGIKIDEEKLLSFVSIKKLVDYISEHKLKHAEERMDWGTILKEKVQLKLPKTWFTQRLFRNVSKLFFKLYFRFNKNGIDNIPEGSCIIAPNHQSYFDGLFIASVLRNKTMRKTYFYAKKKHVSNRFMEFMARRNNVIVMDLNNNLKQSIQKLAMALRKGKKIIIFPEGTRTKTGDLGEFKQMFAILSKELNVPIVPVAISGAYNALPTGKVMPRLFTKVQVQFLPPVYPSNLSYEVLCSKVRSRIEQSIRN